MSTDEKPIQIRNLIAKYTSHPRAYAAILAGQVITASLGEKLLESVNDSNPAESINNIVREAQAATVGPAAEEAREKMQLKLDEQAKQLSELEALKKENDQLKSQGEKLVAENKQLQSENKELLDSVRQLDEALTAASKPPAEEPAADAKDDKKGSGAKSK